MNTFVKIGLPWVISIATVFYLGLKLGSNSQEKERNVAVGSNQTLIQRSQKDQFLKIPEEAQKTIAELGTDSDTHRQTWVKALMSAHRVAVH